MGASPLAAVITLGVAKTESIARLRAIYRGIERIAKKYRVNLVGGETTRAKELFLSVALLGECRGCRPVHRSGVPNPAISSMLLAIWAQPVRISISTSSPG